MEPSVAVERIPGEGYIAKLSAADWELNVSLSVSDVAALRRVQSSPWANGSVRAGESAGAAAFWSVGEDGRVSILVGHDDQTWDFGVSFPMSAFESLLRELLALARG